MPLPDGYCASEVCLAEVGYACTHNKPWYIYSRTSLEHRVYRISSAQLSQSRANETHWLGRARCSDVVSIRWTHRPS